MGKEGLHDPGSCSGTPGPAFLPGVSSPLATVPNNYIRPESGAES